MEVAFWSNIGGKNAVTSNLVGVSIVSALEGRHKSILLENHCQVNNLEMAFVRHKFNLLKEEEQYFYNHVGIDSLMKKIHSQMYSTNMIEQASLQFLNKSIFYIPQSNFRNKEVFEYEFNQIVQPLLEKMNEFTDAVFIDTAGSNNLSTKTILSQADMVVVNLSQDPQIIDHFFENYSSLISKSVFLLGNYNPNSKFNLKNICKKYQIDRAKIGVIPYNITYKDALIDGEAISFLLRNYRCKREDENYYFMKELKKATKMIGNQLDAYLGTKNQKAVGA